MLTVWSLGQEEDLLLVFNSLAGCCQSLVRIGTTVIDHSQAGRRNHQTSPVTTKNYLHTERKKTSRASEMARVATTIVQSEETWKQRILFITTSYKLNEVNVT